MVKTTDPEIEAVIRGLTEDEKKEEKEKRELAQLLAKIRNEEIVRLIEEFKKAEVKKKILECTKLRHEIAQDQVKVLTQFFNLYLSKADAVAAHIKRICEEYKLPLPAEVQALEQEESPSFVT